MTEWELTDEEPTRAELDAIYEIGGTTSDYELAIGRLFVQKYRAYLASQCGDDPCVGCREYQVVTNETVDCHGHDEDCPEYAFFQGQLSERAKCEAEIDKLMEWIGEQQYEAHEYSRIAVQDARCVNNTPEYWEGYATALSKLASFLASKGIGR